MARLTVVIPSITIKTGGMCTEKRLIDALSKYYDVIRVSSEDIDFGVEGVSTIRVETDSYAETADVLSDISADLILWPAVYGYPKTKNHSKVIWIVAVHNRQPDYPGIATLDEIVSEVERRGHLKEVVA